MLWIDTPLAAPRDGEDAITWRKMAQIDYEDGTRYYYTAEAPWRIVLVLRGAAIDDSVWVSGAIFHALTGWDNGTPGFVRPEDERRKHTKLTLFPHAPEAIFPESVRNLSSVLFRSPRSDKRGGFRGTQGRRALDDAGTHQVRTTLTSDQYAYVQKLGAGDVGKGLRDAVMKAKGVDDGDSQA